MFSSRILDVAIGLSFIFLLYSLLVTTVWEALAILFNLRAWTLRSGIKQMLTDTRYRTLKEYIVKAGTITDGPDKGKWKFLPFAIASVSKIFETIGWGLLLTVGRIQYIFNTVEPAKKKMKLWEKFYDHPVIKNYGSGILYKYPSYLPTENFSAILVDILKNQLPDYYEARDKDKYAVYKAKAEKELYKGAVEAKTADIDADKTVDNYTSPEITKRIADAGITDEEIRTKIRQLIIADADATQIQALIAYSYVDDTYIPRETAGILSVMLSEAQVKAKQALDDAYAAQQAEARVTDVAVKPTQLQIDNKTIELFRLLLNKWFDDTMVRVSGWYKRQTQYYLIGLGLMMAVFFNIDTIAITNKLSVDKDARKQITDMATAYMSSHKNDAPRALDTSLNKAVGNQEKKYDSLVDYAQTLLKGDINNANNLLSLGYDGFGMNDPVFISDHILTCDYLKDKLDLYMKDSLAVLKSDRAKVDRDIAGLTFIDSLFLRPDGDLKNYYDTLMGEKKAKKDTVKSRMHTNIDMDSVIETNVRRQDSLNIDTISKRVRKIDMYLYTIDSFRLLIVHGDKSRNKDSLQKDARGKLLSKIDSLQAISDYWGVNKSAIIQKRGLKALYRETCIKTKAIIPVLYVWYAKSINLKWIGFLITAFAISLGAPFWFDLLNKFMQLRGAVKSDEPAKKT